VNASDESDKRIAAIEHRLGMIEMFLDSSLRERDGISTDQIRETWHGHAAKRQKPKTK
jgi:hypothetical protein